MKEKEYKIISPKGVEYTLPESKATAMVERGCKWVDSQPKQRVRRTKEQIEADKKSE